MSRPIPIGGSPYSNATMPTTPPQQQSNKLPIPQPSTSPTSSLSISPQTPFFPPSLASPPLVGAAGTFSTTAPPTSGFFKWASSFGKSPSAPEGLKAPPPTLDEEMTPRLPSQPAQSGKSIPALGRAHSQSHKGAGSGSRAIEEEQEAVEFGEWQDLKSRTWGQNRRAMSMSLPRGGGQSGISAMLSAHSGGAGTASGNGSSTTSGSSGSGQSAGSGASVPMPPSGVMADKAAKGQGVLRRISFSSGLTMPPLLSPSSQPFRSPPLSQVAPAPESGGNAPQQGAQLQRATTISGPPSDEKRGRRFSGSTRKRGVSPMGERLLRDHGHF